MDFPHGHRKTTTLVAGLRMTGMVTPMVLDGPINGDWFEAGRNLGASRLRVLIELALPQVMQTLLVAFVFYFVTMLSVLSVPLTVSSSQPTMPTVDMAFRINAYGDYATANALGVITYLISAGAAILYLRGGLSQEAPR